MLEIGTELGPYKILAPLAAGGMGEVYRARDSRLGRQVALKVLPQQFSNDPERLGRFEGEAKAVAALAHPNILVLYDIGVDDGIFYVVLELLEGETLHCRIDRAPLHWRKVVELGVELADGLAAAHAKGIIHRDLKPANIFLTSDGRVKILDFGLATVAARPFPEEETVPELPVDTEIGKVPGTVPYMSPEQVGGLELDARSDIFSLGCVLYESLTGRAPFGRGNRGDTLRAILQDEPLPLAAAAKNVPADLERVVQHCLEKHAEQRFQSARDLAFALAAVTGKPTPAAASGMGHLFWTAVAVLLALVGAVALWYAITPRPRERSGPITSLAVLPFINVRGDADMDYLSDGIADNLVRQLSQVHTLQVRPFSAVNRYRRDAIAPASAGLELKVPAVVTGRVVKQGENLSVSVELVDVQTNSQLWGKEYRRPFGEIFALQEDIAREIARSLRLNLSGEDRQRLGKEYTQNPEALRYYLLGRYHWNKRTEKGLQEAIGYFEKARDKDSGYALTYAGLADCFTLLPEIAAHSPKDCFAKGKELAKQALSIDASLAEAHASLAVLKEFGDWDWLGAEKEYQQAIELNPNYATAHHWYSNYLSRLGRHDDAVTHGNRAQELDPTSVVITTSLAGILSNARQYDRALTEVQSALKMEPQFLPAHTVLAEIQIRRGSLREALDEVETVIKLSGDREFVGYRGYIYALLRERKRALDDLKELQTLAQKQSILPTIFAFLYAALGDKDQAFAWLGKALAERDRLLMALRVDPAWDRLRADPRFAELERQMHFPP
jgi:serine/threonine-protein kinase